MIETFPGGVKHVVLNKYEFETRDMSVMRFLWHFPSINIPTEEKMTISIYSSANRKLLIGTWMEEVKRITIKKSEFKYPDKSELAAVFAVLALTGF